MHEAGHTVFRSFKESRDYSDFIQTLHEEPLPYIIVLVKP